MTARWVVEHRTAIGLALLAVVVVVSVVVVGLRPRSTDGPPSDAARNVFGTAVPTVSLKLHDPSHAVVSSVPAGTTIHVSITVTGSSGTPTGGVGINRYDGPSCAGSATGGTKASLALGKVDGVVSTSSVTAASMSFKARYGGSATYAVRDSPCIAVSFAKIKPSMNLTIHNPSHASVGNAALGTVLHARVTLGGPIATPTGLVGVNIYAGASCAGAVLKSSGPLQLVNAEVHMTSLTQTATGSAYSFKATYLGDPTYVQTVGPCKAVNVILPGPTG